MSLVHTHVHSIQFSVSVTSNYKINCKILYVSNYSVVTMIILEPGFSTFLSVPVYQTTELNLTIKQNTPQYSKYYNRILKEK